MNKFKHILIAVVLGILVFSPVIAIAQTASTAIDVPKYGGVQDSITQFLCTPSEGPADGKDLERCINKMYRFGISFGGIALVFFLVFAGYMYIMGGESGKTKAKGIVQNALVGLSLLLGSYVILYFINPSLTILKPIQPPIFTADNLPRCEDIGFEDTCVIDGTVVPSGGSGRGEKVPCPDKTIVTIGSLGLPGSSGLKICKAFGEKLLQAYNQTKSTPWVITSTIRDGGAESQCHKAGNDFSGTCADMDFTGADATKVESWNALCRAIKGAGLYPHNEVGHQFKATLNDCGKFNVQKFASKDHVHTAWFSGGSGGGATAEGGTRPNCIAVKNIAGVCDDGLASSNKYKSGDFDNATKELKTAYDQLKAKHPGISAKQVYRSPQYGAHMRSVFEAHALINGWTEAEIKSYGQYCQQTGIQYVKKADVDGYDQAAKNWVKTHFNDHFNGFTSPMTCYSDHGKGIAFDLEGAPNSPAFEQSAKSFGLCHSVPRNISAHGIKMQDDLPHWALASKIPGGESSCVSYVK